jgi:hypothetical protein
VHQLVLPVTAAMLMVLHQAQVAQVAQALVAMAALVVMQQVALVATAVQLASKSEAVPTTIAKNKQKIQQNEILIFFFLFLLMIRISPHLVIRDRI